MGKKLNHDNEAPETEDILTPEQGDLDIVTAAAAGPVECLGVTFPSDQARREHYLKLLAEKLKEPDFRKIEGFPIGEDEDILALSDPPYYTACPNPWLADFVKHYGKPYNPKDKYHREPFAADVSEGKTHPIYNAHSYHTKVPHRAIMRYILHYTNPGDLVFDGFAGTGMTGVAAQLCADNKEVEALDYKVLPDGTIQDQAGASISNLGARRAILNDLSPAATFIARNYTIPVNAQAFEKKATATLKAVEAECGWMYETTHAEARAKGRINYVIWSDVFNCPECAGEVNLWGTTVDVKKKQLLDEFECPHCSAHLTKRKMNLAKESQYDSILGEAISQGKRVPVLITYTFDRQRFDKKPDRADLELIRKIESLKIPYDFPVLRMPPGDESRRNDPAGMTHVHHFYTRRNLYCIAALRKHAAQDLSVLFWINAADRYLSRLSKVGMNYFLHGGGGAINAGLLGTLYVPSFSVENSPLNNLRIRLSKTKEVFGMLKNKAGYSITATQSATSLKLPDESLDYIFLDPPFGANLTYSDLSVLWESWLKVKTATEWEAIESKGHDKTLATYSALMVRSFREAFRILKPGRWITVEFSNTQSSVWNALQATLQEAGFVIASVAALDKQQRSFKAVTTPTAVKQDLVISAYKPSGELEDRFAKKGETEEAVWDFIRTHLSNLPVVKPKGGQLEPIAERDARILFDRTVAFYVRHGIPVPISSPEFQAGLAEKFPERDGMFFLPDQAAEYDRVRMKMEGIGQLTIFVEDERSAVDWLRNYLKNKPSKYNEVMPEFFEQLNQSWKKWETKPELRALLDQYFLCYLGEGTVPSQIHSYLSTNFKELRTLPADHPMLRDKGRDRWFVPDPRKNADVEQLREKRLLEEFWSYLPPGYEASARTRKPNEPVLPGMLQAMPKLPKGKRIQIVRTEAVRVGFNYCFARNDYHTIIAVTRHIPDDVIHNDEQLQMIYDSAVTRTGADAD